MFINWFRKKEKNTEGHNKGIKCDLLTERQRIGEKMGCDVYNLTDLDNFAISTVLLAKNIEKCMSENECEKFLCRDTVACCDTIIFSAFVLRACCICNASSKEKAIEFSDEYLLKVKRGTEYLYASACTFFDDMFKNRNSLYDEVFMSKSSIEDSLPAVLEKFNIILMSDYQQNSYEPFYQSSPFPLLSIFDAFSCESQSNLFFHYLPDFVSPYYQRVRASLSNYKNARGL